MDNDEIWVTLNVQRSVHQRQLISQRGLRRDKDMEGVWVIVAYDPSDVDVSCGQKCYGDDGSLEKMDTWSIKVLRGWAEPFGGGWYAVHHDIPSRDCTLQEGGDI